jgi:hypothetical protein
MRKRVGIVIIFGVLGYLIGMYKPPAVSSPRFVDRCPTQQRPPPKKISSRITRVGTEWNVENDVYSFRFSFPDAWRFEENTLQDREEPISTPGYLYSFLLTYGAPFDVSHRAPAEIRLLVYPSWCNSVNQTRAFYIKEGWQQEGSDVLVRTDGGRHTRMYIRNQGIFQYVFLLSQDVLIHFVDVHMEDIVRSMRTGNGGVK